jgi:2,4-dienoyl-CoA reductase-like NADH-dependent reductase (Old Yellow Enzyme family)
MPSLLFSELTLRSTTFRNRIWVAPLCQYSVFGKDGVPGDWHLVHLGGMAVGGAGLVLCEATAVCAEGRITERDTGIWNDTQVEAWSRITAFIRSQGAVAGIQLAHAGRKASLWPDWGTVVTGKSMAEGGSGTSVSHADGGWPTVAPSAVAFGGLARPAALDAQGIERVITLFADAAGRAVEAGFEVIELHAAHGYLFHEFLSPLSNVRDDGYGGDLAARARLLLETVRAVRSRVGSEVPLLVRLSATDYTDGGVTPEETAIVSRWIIDAGGDLIDVSTGGNVPDAVIPVGPSYQVPYAEHVRAASGVPVAAVGIITTPEQAEQILASGQADAVFFGREMMRDPHFALRAAHRLGEAIDYWPGQYRTAHWREHETQS